MGPLIFARKSNDLMGTNAMRTAVVAAACLALSVGAYAQDAENGADIFKKCPACHQIGENAKNAVGPKLNGLFGRKMFDADGKQRQ